ncbi:MAG: histidine phosphatase family protein [Ferruginibacter sp.]
MRPSRIILIRHGESESNVDKTIYCNKPDYTLELTAKGLSQADEAGITLKKMLSDETICFYISPYWRSRATFEQVVKHFEKTKIQWREEPRLREQEWGYTKDPAVNIAMEKERADFGTFYFRLPNGESGADVYDRVSDFFGTLHRDFDKNNFPQNAVIITHGMTIRTFLMRWFHWTVEQFEEYDKPANCQILVLEKGTDGKYHLLTELKKRNTVHHYQRPTRID